MEIKTTNEILERDYNIKPEPTMMDERELKESSKMREEFGKKKWVTIDDMIEELKKQGITKYHILGELLNSQSNEKKQEAGSCHIGE